MNSPSSRQRNFQVRSRCRSRLAALYCVRTRIRRGMRLWSRVGEREVDDAIHRRRERAGFGTLDREQGSGKTCPLPPARTSVSTSYAALLVESVSIGLLWQLNRMERRMATEDGEQRASGRSSGGHQ